MITLIHSSGAHLLAEIDPDQDPDATFVHVAPDLDTKYQRVMAKVYVEVTDRDPYTA